MISTARKAERALLVSAQVFRRHQALPMRASLSELGELARTAGAKVVGSLTQQLKKPTHYYLGRGKLEQLKETVLAKRIDTVICDDELTPTQQRNLERALEEKVKVIDRTALILDVFAARAQTREGRLQVELAQHEYLMPRLAGQWSHLERLGGGIGTRGPGESQIETDRRLVRNRIQRIKKALGQVSRQRDLYRARRRNEGIPVVSLVGYTNAGKSTLLNSLTAAGVTAEDKLFSTLDPVTRKVRLDSGKEVLFTDTVGFIQKLPPAIVAAFRATLEEIREARIIVHVADVSSPNLANHIDEVESILDDLKITEKPTVLALNKTDLLPGAGDSRNGDLLPEILKADEPPPGVVFISATEHLGLKDLLGEVERLLGVEEPVESVVVTA
ncbi:MAG: GTPase HflX [Dehalococcoidia bacterium]|nr:GTPase HflX [Dehalococcoidia bacterium]